MRQVAFLFPGQGAQYPMMGKDFFDNFSANHISDHKTLKKDF